MIISTNFYPFANPEDKAFFRRVALMRFPVCFTDKNPDKNLLNKLKKEVDGIFLWALEGLTQYFSEGLDQTVSMKKELNNYKKYIEPLTSFFTDSISITNREEDFVLVDDIVHAVEEYLEINDLRRMRKSEILNYFKRKGIEITQRRIKGERRRGFVGIELITFRDNDFPF